MEFKKFKEFMSLRSAPPKGNEVLTKPRLIDNNHFGN